MLLLRHGQSAWNARRRWQGTADIALTELGRSQASYAAGVLAASEFRFGDAWASNLERASETASIISEHLELGTVERDARLRESHAGEWQGLTPEQIEAGWPGYLAAHRRPPGFEPIEEVVDRSLTALRDIASRSNGDGHPLVVAHSGVIRSIVRYLGRTDSRIPNLGGVWLTVDTSVPSRSRADVAGLSLGDLFDPAGIVISGVDAPGEDPGEQADQTDAHSAAER